MTTVHPDVNSVSVCGLQQFKTRCEVLQWSDSILRTAFGDARSTHLPTCPVVGQAHCVAQDPNNRTHPPSIAKRMCGIVTIVQFTLVERTDNKLTASCLQPQMDRWIDLIG